MMHKDIIKILDDWYIEEFEKGSRVKASKIYKAKLSMQCKHKTYMDSYFNDYSMWF